MKKLLTLVVTFTTVMLSSCKYDDGALWDSVHGLEDRVAKLEELCKQMNTNITSLQTIINALQDNDYITSITPVMRDGKEIGYTITFSKSDPITIYHGEDGQDGEDGTDGIDGTTPIVGVKQDVDGIYYWTLNDEWLTDDQGDKIKAEGMDGNDGSNGITPKFKIENDYWYISYNNGDSWEQLGKATGEDGTNGEPMFTDVDYETSDDYVIFTLTNGTQIKIPTWYAFEALQRLCNEINTNLSSLQAIVSALQNNDYITSVDPLTEDGKVIGYTIKFAKSNPIVIYNGQDGADGVNGNTPVIGIKEDTDGIYYWTLDGEFIVVDGQKIKAQGTDGSDGSDGSDGVTPKLEIRDGYWWISYNNGDSWEQLGKATGEDGKDGESVEITQDENNVYFELADGSVITIPKSGGIIDPDIIQFEDVNVKKLCVTVWDTDGDNELSQEEAAAVTTLGTLFKGNTEIQLFNELKYFTGVSELNNTFYGCSNLWKVTIPANVTTISSTTFNNCSQLKRVAFDKESNLKTIPANLFANLSSLTTVQIPASVEIIEQGAFASCRSLLSVTIEQGSHLKEIRGANSRSGKDLGAFFNCEALQSIKIPASVEIIGQRAFMNCESLTTVTFEKESQLKTIEGDGDDDESWGAFTNCIALTAIEIPASVTTIEAAAFKGCSSLATVTFEKGSQLETIEGKYDSITNNASWTSTYYYYGVFTDCTALTTIEIPASVITIKQAAFKGCSSLTTITFETGSNLKTIESNAFANIGKQVTVDMSECENVTNFWSGTFTDSTIKLFKIGTKIPPTCYDATFNGVTSGVLQVPSECIDAYKSATGWEKFGNITALDE